MNSIVFGYLQNYISISLAHYHHTQAECNSVPNQQSPRIKISKFEGTNFEQE